MSDNHGNTPAAWTAVFASLAGFVLGGVALMLSPVSYTLFWVGVVLAVPVAILVFVVMTKMGLGDANH
jgi:hypothetical protein